MIIGMGSDIAELARIGATVEKYGEAFLARCFTEEERRIASTRGGETTAFFAGRWAAKEALSKALGCGIGQSCGLTDIEILNDPAGAPVMTLSGKAAETFRSRGGGKIWLSISHERAFAIATVILEKSQEE